ncbi:MAG TPA: sigma-70 family RNA polymerase sigma factor [Terracidiphilus sp.]|nr:sigma-70 family RNA polymerase sigma factor [Terracidiphilus sp.]
MSNMNVSFNVDAKQEEQQLLSSAQAGNAEAFEKLIKPHVNALLRVTQRMLRNREDAEDTVQTTLLKAWRSLNTFQGRSQFSSWLNRIAINSALMKMRANRRIIDLSLDEVVLGDMPAGVRAAQIGRNPEEGYSAKEVLGIVESMFDRLPPRHAEVLWMSAFQELNGKEVARILNVSVATVKSRLYRARAILSQSARPMLVSRRRCANSEIRRTAALAPQMAAR